MDTLGTKDKRVSYHCSVIILYLILKSVLSFFSYSCLSFQEI
jgi:hypothetical protein